MRCTICNCVMKQSLFFGRCNHPLAMRRRKQRRKRIEIVDAQRFHHFLLIWFLGECEFMKKDAPKMNAQIETIAWMCARTRSSGHREHCRSNAHAIQLCLFLFALFCKQQKETAQMQSKPKRFSVSVLTLRNRKIDAKQNFLCSRNLSAIHDARMNNRRNKKKPLHAHVCNWTSVACRLLARARSFVVISFCDCIAITFNPVLHSRPSSLDSTRNHFSCFFLLRFSAP